MFLKSCFLGNVLNWFKPIIQ